MWPMTPSFGRSRHGSQLFGAVNFEVFGRLTDIVEDVDAVFDQSVRDMSAFVGLVDSDQTALPFSQGVS